MATDMTCTYRPCEPHLAETPAMFPSGHQDAGLVEIPSISPRGSESLAYTVVPRTSARVHLTSQYHISASQPRPHTHTMPINWNYAKCPEASCDKPSFRMRCMYAEAVLF